MSGHKSGAAVARKQLMDCWAAMMCRIESCCCDGNAIVRTDDCSGEGESWMKERELCEVVDVGDQKLIKCHFRRSRESKAQPTLTGRKPVTKKTTIWQPCHYDYHVSSSQK